MSTISFPKNTENQRKKKSQCKSDKDFEKWQSEHLTSNECDINFKGSLHAMEAEGATVLWNTSMQQHNLRSRWMVSDGVSKGFNVVENTHNGFQFEKLDCVGHVQKQMEKHLIDLKVTTKGKLSDGKPIGGQGRLTEGQIKCLQKYYELAIRQKLILCQRQIPLRGKLMLLFTP